MKASISLPYPQHPFSDPDTLLDAAIVRQTMRRLDAGADLSALTTQVMLSVALPLQAGDKVAKLGFRSGGTAAGTPTNWWFALYGPDGALISQSADQTNTAWAANTVKQLALAKTYEVPAAGVHYAAIMVKATTPPSLVGRAVQHADVSDGLITGQLNLAQTSGSSLTATAPATIATPAAVVNVPWAIATAS